MAPLLGWFGVCSSCLRVGTPVATPQPLLIRSVTHVSHTCDDRQWGYLGMLSAGRASPMGLMCLRTGLLRSPRNTSPPLTLVRATACTSVTSAALRGRSVPVAPRSNSCRQGGGDSVHRAMDHAAQGSACEGVGWRGTGWTVSGAQVKQLQTGRMQQRSPSHGSQVSL